MLDSIRKKKKMKNHYFLCNVRQAVLNLFSAQVLLAVFHFQILWHPWWQTTTKPTGSPLKPCSTPTHTRFFKTSPFCFGQSCCCCWLLLYSVILHSQADSLCLHAIVHERWAFYVFWISTEVVYLQCWHGWCHIKLLSSWYVLCTPYNYAPCHFMQSHICKVHAYFAVTCHLHFWQNDWDLLLYYCGNTGAEQILK